MSLSSVGTIISLAFAPAFLIYINYFSPDESSFFYMGAKLVPTLYSLVFLSLFTAAVFSKKHLVLKLTKKFYKENLGEKEQEYLKRGDFYWMMVTFSNTIALIGVAYLADDTTWALYSSVGWYIYFLCALLLQIAYGKLFYKSKSFKEEI
ncbi:MAG: hypothetical protein U9O86_09160 [Campylobacterota bacterium]|nr:hypothetical protein [Campylobacterota bacterium]